MNSLGPESPPHSLAHGLNDEGETIAIYSWRPLGSKKANLDHALHLSCAWAASTQEQGKNSNIQSAACLYLS